MSADGAFDILDKSIWDVEIERDGLMKENNFKTDSFVVMSESGPKVVSKRR